MITFNTCAKYQGVSLKRGADIWTVVRESAKILVLLSFRVCLILGVKYDLILILRSQFFEYLRETLYKHAAEHLEAARPENKMGNIFPFLR